MNDIKREIVHRHGDVTVVAGVFSQGATFIVRGQAPAMLVVAHFKGTASFSYVKFVTFFARKLVDQKFIVTTKTRWQVETNSAILAFWGVVGSS